MALTEPDSIERDAGKITVETTAKYEVDTGKTLYPVQVGRLLIDPWVYREMLARVAVQETTKQSLIVFVRESMVDYPDELVGIHRLAAQPVTTAPQPSVDEVLIIDILTLTDTRVSAPDSVILVIDTDVVLKAGLLLVNVTFTCAESDTAGNGWRPVQVSQLLDKIDNVDLLVSNLTISSGGSEQEDDDRPRGRIGLAPESSTSAGGHGAYHLHAMQAHSDIVDAAVFSPVSGTVGLYPLLSTGLPDGGVLTLVESLCFDEKVRSFTDAVRVKTPAKVDYTIEARITICRDQGTRSIKDAANSAVQNQVTLHTAMLGRDIIPSQITGVLFVSGVYQVELVTPALRVVVENE